MIPIFMMFMLGKPGETGFANTFHSVQEAIATSLFAVFMNAFSGTFAYIRQKRVFFKAAIPFAIATFPGAFLGSYVDSYFTGRSFAGLFGAVLVILAAFVYIKSKSQKATQKVFDSENFHFNCRLGIGLSLFVGFISSLLGIGGGIINVPMMIYLLSFPPHVATATSHFILACSSFAGCASNFFYGRIVWQPAICIGLGAILGAQLGARISKKTKPRSIVILLSAAMCLLGIKLVLGSL